MTQNSLDYACRHNRFEIQKAPFPDISCSKNWFRDVLYPQDTHAPTVAIDYETHRKAIQRMKDRLGLVTNKSTHLWRGSGAKMAELGGALGEDVVEATWSPETPG